VTNIGPHWQTKFNRVCKVVKKQAIYLEVCRVSICQYVFFRVLLMYDVQNNLLELLELCIMVPIKSMIKEFIEGESPTHCFNQEIQSLLEKFPAIDFE
jgi:hypothetical protein